jgi:ATP-binding cassette subfamily C protein CydCD
VIEAIRAASAAGGTTTRARMVGLALLRLAERLSLMVAALAFARQTLWRAAVVSIGMGGLVVVRNAMRAAVRSRCEAALLSRAVEALVTGDVLRASAVPDEDTQLAVVDGADLGARLVADHVPEFMADAVAACLLVIAIAYLEPLRMLGVVGAALALATMVIVVSRRWITLANAVERERYVAMSDGVIAAIRARLEILASAHEGSFVARVRDDIWSWQGSTLRAQWISALAGRASVLAAAVGAGLVVVLDRSVHGSFEGSFLGDAVIVATVVPPVLGCGRSAYEAVRIQPVLSPLLRLLRRAPWLHTTDLAPPLPPSLVEWRSVSFSYDADVAPLRRAIAHVSARWKTDGVLAITGPNGSGKSTLLRLLLGLGKPQEGTITLDGTDLFACDLRAWRRQIAYLPQRPYLPDRATVREAVRLIAVDAADAAIRAALERVGLWETLRARSSADPLAASMDTLSTGERQRVALARVLVQDKAVIVLLDEPEANMDAEGVDLVAALVRELALTRAVALVAHTERVVRVASQVVSLGETAVRPESAEKALIAS